MRKILNFVNDNAVMLTSYAIGILTFVFFILQEYTPAMIGLVALELQLLNTNIDLIVRRFKR